MRMTRQVGAALCAAMLSLAAFAARADDAHALLIQSVHAWDASDDRHHALPFLERAYQEAPDDPLVMLHLDKFCRGAMVEVPMCADHDWPRRIAESDPTNGAPWIELASRAAQVNDWSAARDLLTEAIERNRYDGYFGRHISALYFAFHRMQDEGRTRDELQTWLDAMGIAAAGFNYEASIHQVCHETDGDVRTLHLCRRLAGQMLDHARSRIGVVIATGVLRRQPTESENARIAALRDEYDRVSRALVELEPRLRADPTLIEEIARSMGQHGERLTWLRFTGQ